MASLVMACRNLFLGDLFHSHVAYGSRRYDNGRSEGEGLVIEVIFVNKDGFLTEDEVLFHERLGCFHVLVQLTFLYDFVSFFNNILLDRSVPGQ